MTQKTIFIVEDDKDLLFIYNLILKEQYIIYTFEEANEYFFNMLDEKKPDLVLLDWMIPSINSDLVIEVIKNQHPTIKVLVISALNDIKKLVSEADADAILQKPVHMHVIQNVIKDLVNRNSISGKEEFI